MKTDIEYLTAAKDVIVKRDTTYNDWDFMRQKMTEKPSEMVIDALSQRLERSALLALQNKCEDLKSELKAKIKGSKIATYGQGYGESFNGGLNKVLEILNSL